MPYTVSALTTPADCDAVIAFAQKEKAEFIYQKTTLERRQVLYDENAPDVNSDLVARTAEVAVLSTVVTSLPEGSIKEDNLRKLRRAENALSTLKDQAKNYTKLIFITREFAMERLVKEIEESDNLIAVIEAHKAGL